MDKLDARLSPMVKTAEACLDAIIHYVRPDDVTEEFFGMLALFAGDNWVIGREQKLKVAYGRGMFQFVYRMMPDWMLALAKHKTACGAGSKSAVRFIAENGEILPPDAEKLCLYWHDLISGVSAEDIIMQAWNKGVVGPYDEELTNLEGM